MSEIAIIGDIHGCLKPLRDIVEVATARSRTLVFLGDYVDRGAESRQVIDYLIKLSARDDLIVETLRGNHDAAFLRVLNGGEVDEMLRMGGAPTIRSYVNPPYSAVADELRASVPDSHRKFLASLGEEFRAPGLYVVHDAPTELPDDFTVSGHSVQPNEEPRISGHLALIDTGCGTAVGGRLTCLFWPSMQWVQSEPVEI